MIESTVPTIDVMSAEHVVVAADIMCVALNAIKADAESATDGSR